MIPKRFSSAVNDALVGFFTDSCSSAVKVAEVADMQVSTGSVMVATIGFTSAEITGSLIVLGRQESLHKTHPMVALGATVSEGDLNDWSGEIANQVLGRVKNVLIDYGITLQMTVPSILRATDLSLSQQQGTEQLKLSVKADNGVVFGFAVLFSFAPGYNPASLDAAVAQKQAAKKEGDGFLF